MLATSSRLFLPVETLFICSDQWSRLTIEFIHQKLPKLPIRYSTPAYTLPIEVSKTLPWGYSLQMWRLLGCYKPLGTSEPRIAHQGDIPIAPFLLGDPLYGVIPILPLLQAGQKIYRHTA